MHTTVRLVTVFLTGALCLQSASVAAAQNLAPPPPTSTAAQRLLAFGTQPPQQWPSAHTPPDGTAPQPQSPQAPTLSTWPSIAFASYRPGNYDIYKAAGDGSAQVRLSTSTSSDIQPDLNRGGTKIAFVAYRNGNAEIYTMNVNGTSQTRLTAHSAADMHPRWSPNGAKIAFESARSGLIDIYVMNATGTGLTNLTPNTANAQDITPAWSPDGTRIVFGSNRSGAWALWVMNADGTNPQQLSPNLNFAGYPDWSPDGSRIIFNDNVNDDNWADLALINADGSGLSHPLGPTADLHDRLAPVWDPTGTYVAYAYIQYVYQQETLYWLDAYINYINPANNTGEAGLIGSGYDWWPSWRTTDVSAPSVSTKALPRWTTSSPFGVQWTGGDVGAAGIRSVELQVRDGQQGTWQTFATSSNPAEVISFNGAHGHSYYFRDRGTDNAWNVQAFPVAANGTTSTTVDLQGPTNLTLTTPAFTRQRQFTVTWGATDDVSGIGGYDIDVRVDSAVSTTRWFSGTKTTAARYSAPAGNKTFCFILHARDVAGNYDVNTSTTHCSTVDEIAPTTSLQVPQPAPAPSFVVSWSGVDADSGIAGYDVQYRRGMTGTWTPWLTGTTAGNALFYGQLNTTYVFRARATDQVGNVEAFPTVGVSTTTPLLAWHGAVQGNRGQPVVAATVSAQPAALAPALSDMRGQYNLYFNTAGVYTLSVADSRFGSLPPRKGVTVTAALTDYQPVTLVLPPADDAVSNGQFETGDLSGWIPSGSVGYNAAPPAISADAHTGNFALRLGGPAQPPTITHAAAFTVSATIGTAGGVVSSDSITASFDAGVLTDEITLTLTSVQAVTGLPPNTQEAGSAFSLTAVLSDGAPLAITALPFTLSVRYDDAQWQSAQIAGESTLAVWFFDEPSGQWLALASTVDGVGNTVTLTATQPGLYALFGQPHAGPWVSQVEQPVNLPTLASRANGAAPVSPTLSLLYWVTGTPQDGDRLYAVLSTPSEAFTLTLPLTGCDWQHAWAALPNWATALITPVTLRIQWAQSERVGSAGVVVDEVSLGSFVPGPVAMFIPLVQRGNP